MSKFEALKPNIVFMGTPEFALRPLEALVKAGYRAIGVITAPDKPKGRKQVPAAPAIKKGAETLGLPVFQPENKERLLEIMKKLRPELAVIAAFGMIIPKEILAVPRYGIINIHASLLPRWRGASPIQASILAGDEETGVTLMLIDEKMDEGPILAQREFPISVPPGHLPKGDKFQIPNSKITAAELSEALSELGARLLIETLPKWISGEIKPEAQDHSRATYCKIIKKGDGKIDWSKPAGQIERMTRAFWPWPSAYTEFRIQNSEFRILKIIKAEIGQENHHEMGEVFLTADKKPAVRCGEGSVVLESVQPEGKKIMSGKDFLLGHAEIIGTVLK